MKVGRPRILWNEHFFDVLTSDAAYLLGFLVADGCLLAKRQSGIWFTQSERDILMRIARVLDYGGEPNSRGWLRLTSSHAWSVLHEKYGIPVRKSSIVRLPQVDKILVPHLIRGLFDGDGHVRGDGSVFLLCSGSEQLIGDFTEIMVNCVGLPFKRCQRLTNDFLKEDGTQAGCFVAMWTSMIHSMAFAKFIYGDDLAVFGSDLYLERKKTRFEQLFVPWRDKGWLRKAIEDGKSCADIAYEFNILPATVGMWIKKLNV